MARKVGKTRRQELADIDHIMSMPQGQRFIWRLLSQTGVFRSSFSSDALAMAFNEGGRNVGLRLQADILEACPEKFINLMRTSKTRREKEEEEREHVTEEDHEELV